MYEYEENDNIYDKTYIEKLDLIEDFVSQKHAFTTLALDHTEVSNSTKIEGNRLSKEQVKRFLEDDVTVRGVSLRDFVQVKNYAAALDSIKEELLSVKQLSAEFICGVHYMVTVGELSEAGIYRDDFVHIRTTNTIPPDAEQVPMLMEELIDRYNTAINDPMKNKFETICEFKRNFERIHPFFDGNGRTGRLIMNALFLSNGYPCVTIPAELRPEYFDALEYNTLCSFVADRMIEAMERIIDKEIEEQEQEVTRGDNQREELRDLT